MFIKLSVAIPPVKDLKIDKYQLGGGDGTHDTYDTEALYSFQSADYCIY